MALSRIGGLLPPESQKVLPLSREELVFERLYDGNTAIPLARHDSTFLHQARLRERLGANLHTSSHGGIIERRSGARVQRLGTSRRISQREKHTLLFPLYVYSYSPVLPPPGPPAPSSMVHLPSPIARPRGVKRLKADEARASHLTAFFQLDETSSGCRMR